jgi:hypothetical protein
LDLIALPATPPRSVAGRAARAPVAMSTTRHSKIEIPDGICLHCLNTQQQFAFPFLVYCSHHANLAIIRAFDQHVTFPCAEQQLPAVVARLRSVDASLKHLSEVDVEESKKEAS